MRTPLIALASAILLAFIVIQLNVLFFADDQLTVQHHLSLLVLTAAALFINGLFNARLALRDAPKKGRGRDRSQDRRNTKRRKGRDGDGPRNDKDRNDRNHKDSDRTAKEKNSRNGDRQRDKNARGEPRRERRSPKVADGANSEKTSPSLMPKGPAMAKTAGPTLFPRQHQQMRSAATSNGSTEPRATASLFESQAKKSLSTNAALCLKRRVSAARCEMVRPSPLSSSNMIRVCRQTE